MGNTRYSSWIKKDGDPRIERGPLGLGKMPDRKPNQAKQHARKFVGKPAVKILAECKTLIQELSLLYARRYSSSRTTISAGRGPFNVAEAQITGRIRVVKSIIEKLSGMLDQKEQETVKLLLEELEQKRAELAEGHNTTK